MKDRLSMMQMILDLPSTATWEDVFRATAKARDAEVAVFKFGQKMGDLMKKNEQRKFGGAT